MEDKNKNSGGTWPLILIVILLVIILIATFSGIISKIWPGLLIIGGIIAWRLFSNE